MTAEVVTPDGQRLSAGATHLLAPRPSTTAGAALGDSAPVAVRPSPRASLKRLLRATRFWSFLDLLHEVLKGWGPQESRIYASDWSPSPVAAPILARLRDGAAPKVQKLVDELLLRGPGQGKRALE